MTWYDLWMFRTTAHSGEQMLDWGSGSIVVNNLWTQLTRETVDCLSRQSKMVVSNAAPLYEILQGSFLVFPSQGYLAGVPVKELLMVTPFAATLNCWSLNSVPRARGQY